MYDTPKEMPLAEITLRKYEKQADPSKRELIKRLCLSLGLLQPGDSRDVIVDILTVLLIAKQERLMLSSSDIEKKVLKIRKKLKLGSSGTAPSNIRRQIKRLRDILLVERMAGRYRLSEFLDFHDIFENKIKRFYFEEISSRVSELCSQIDEAR